MMGGELQNIKK